MSSFFTALTNCGFKVVNQSDLNNFDIIEITTTVIKELIQIKISLFSTRIKIKKSSCDNSILIKTKQLKRRILKMRLESIK